MKSPGKMSLGRALTSLLRVGGEGELSRDDDGWASVADTTRLAGELLERTVESVELRRLARSDKPRRFEFSENGERIRAVRRGSHPAPSSRGKGRRRGGQKGRQPAKPQRSPDILFHATTVERVEELRASGVISGAGGRDLYLSTDEASAWRVAHRSRQAPAVIVIDTRRLAKSRVVLKRSRTGLYMASTIPLRSAISVHDGYAEQHSAGGVLCRQRDGRYEFALVSCKRRRATWEVAKGKIEPGESAVEAAKRELQEEMGFEAELSVVKSLGMVRYAFTIPNGDPRLKAMHLYLFSADPEPEVFDTAIEEGIMGVEWVSPREAKRRVVHSSLRPVMAALLEEYGE